MNNGFLKKITPEDGKILLENIGWLASLRSGAILDDKNKIIPWYCYSMVHFLQEKLGKNMNIFEYGSGFSTIFYAKLCKKVTSIEMSQVVKEKIENILNIEKITNFSIKLQPDKDDFPNEISKYDENFDLIIVDSVNRNKCIEESVKYLTKNGVVLLDNSDRQQYKNSFDYMHKNDFKALTFKGIKPYSLQFAYSTIFYRQNNIFNI